MTDDDAISEPVKRAILALQEYGQTTDALKVGTQLSAIVRIVLRAIREPDADMYEALSAKDKLWREMNSEEVWQTYIDHLLRRAMGAPGSVPPK